MPDHRPPSRPDGPIPKQIHLDLAVADLSSAVADAAEPETAGRTGPAAHFPGTIKDRAGQRRILED